MRKVINHPDSIYHSLMFKTAVRSGEFSQAASYAFGGDSQRITGGKACKGVADIMQAGDAQLAALNAFSVVNDIEGSKAVFIEGDVSGCPGGIWRIQSIVYGLAGKLSNELCHPLIIDISNKGSTR